MTHEKEKRSEPATGRGEVLYLIALEREIGSLPHPHPLCKSIAETSALGPFLHQPLAEFIEGGMVSPLSTRRCFSALAPCGLGALALLRRVVDARDADWAARGISTWLSEKTDILGRRGREEIRLFVACADERSRSRLGGPSSGAAPIRNRSDTSSVAADDDSPPTYDGLPSPKIHYMIAGNVG